MNLTPQAIPAKPQPGDTVTLDSVLNLVLDIGYDADTGELLALVQPVDKSIEPEWVYTFNWTEEPTAL